MCWFSTNGWLAVWRSEKKDAIRTYVRRSKNVRRTVHFLDESRQRKRYVIVDAFPRAEEEDRSKGIGERPGGGDAARACTVTHEDIREYMPATEASEMVETTTVPLKSALKKTKVSSLFPSSMPYWSLHLHQRRHFMTSST